MISAVYGFLEERLVAAESGQGYSVRIGYIKRPDSVDNLIRGSILVADGGTAGEKIYLCLCETVSLVF